VTRRAGALWIHFLRRNSVIANPKLVYDRNETYRDERHVSDALWKQNPNLFKPGLNYHIHSNHRSLHGIRQGRGVRVPGVGPRLQLWSDSCQKMVLWTAIPTRCTGQITLRNRNKCSCVGACSHFNQRPIHGLWAPSKAATV
jgi:hypothetical protein